MPADRLTAPPSDHFYTVTQLAQELGVTARTIRFYEDRELIIPRRAGTTRVYTHRDRARMTLILRGKRLGFSLREIKDYLDLYDIDTTQIPQMRMLLKAVKTRIAQLEDQKIALDQALGDLREVERQAMTALEAPAPPRRKLAG